MNTMPMGLASAMTGLPMKKTAKPTRRGRKPSAKPGAVHLAALQQAHGAGNFAQARTHALNYAKATMPTAAPMGDSETGETGMDIPASPALPSMAMPKAAPPSPRARLASLAMGRKKAAL